MIGHALVAAAALASGGPSLSYYDAKLSLDVAGHRIEDYGGQANLATDDATMHVSGVLPGVRFLDGKVQLGMGGTLTPGGGDVKSHRVTDDGGTVIDCHGTEGANPGGGGPTISASIDGPVLVPWTTLAATMDCVSNQDDPPWQERFVFPVVKLPLRIPAEAAGAGRILVPIDERIEPCPLERDDALECTYHVRGTLELTRTDSVDPPDFRLSLPRRPTVRKGALRVPVRCSARCRVRVDVRALGGRRSLAHRTATVPAKATTTVAVALGAKARGAIRAAGGARVTATAGDQTRTTKVKP